MHLSQAVRGGDFTSCKVLLVSCIRSSAAREPLRSQMQPNGEARTIDEILTVVLGKWQCGGVARTLL